MEKTETASRVRGRIESVLDWCTVRGYRTGDNPARWKGHLSEVLPARGQVAKVNHHAALPYAELPAFMAELRKREGVAARALEFAILSAARTGEVIGAQWDEIDLDDKTWMIPAGRMKGGKEHQVPLIGARHRAAARAADRGWQRLRLLGIARRQRFEQHGDDAGAQTHGSRRRHRAWISQSSFRDWASETTNFPNHVVEMALAHVDRRQGGGGLSARRSAGQTPTARRGVVEILHVTATGWRGAADAEASMKPEDLKPENAMAARLAAPQGAMGAAGCREGES